MPFLIEGENELISYLILLHKIRDDGFKSSRYKELLNCVVSIEYEENKFNEFLSFKDSYFKSVGKTAEISWNRATRVYTNLSDRMTKPSYLKRLTAYEESIKGEIHEIDQLGNIINELAHRPKHSLLSFTIFRPSDLINKKRPGYVPCPISGDFKFRKGELHFSVFFRSHDALNLGYADIYFLRLLQKKVLEEAKLITSHRNLKKGKIGTLNLHFSRVYIPLRMEMRKREYVNGPEVESILQCLISKLGETTFPMEEQVLTPALKETTV